MIRLANLLQAPTVSIYQLVKTKTFALYLFDMVKWIKWKNEKKWKMKKKYTKYGGETSPRPFSEKLKSSISLD